MKRLDAVIGGRGADRRYLALCLVGAVVSASAACAVLIGQVPVGAVPAGGVLAAACAILAMEWLFAAALLVIRADRPVQEPGAVQGFEPADVGALQDRIEQLTAALTLAAAAEDLNRVGAIVEDALAADLRDTAAVFHR
jgi:hypothetical protein